MFRARLTPLNDFISSATHTFCYAVLKQLLLAINSLKMSLKVVKSFVKLSLVLKSRCYLKEEHPFMFTMTDILVCSCFQDTWLCGITVIMRSVERPLEATFIHNLGTNTQISDFSSNKFRQYNIKLVEEWVNQILSSMVILVESLSMS